MKRSAAQIAEVSVSFAGFGDYAASLKPSLDAFILEQLSYLPGGNGAAPLNGALRGLTQGKKTRGSLLCLVAAALGAGLEHALPRAVAVELIQTATLIHDDFVDQHRSRRGLPALWTLTGARRAVLLGDVLFASAIHMMSELGPEDGRIVSRAIAEVSRGALQEPLDAVSLADEIETGRLNAALYESIIHLKTGVLFGAACQLGAVAARTDPGAQQAWLDYGRRVGEAYQIADDLHEVRRCLAARTCGLPELVAIAPALLFFVQDAGPALLQAARSARATPPGELLEQLGAAAASMNAEIDKRLAAAVAAVEGQLPAGAYSRLAREAPQGVIRMFNDSDPTASAP